MARRKLERLDTAYVENRIELTRLLDDFQQLAEVKARLTERIEGLTAQILQAKQLLETTEELYAGGDREGQRELVPRPPSTPPLEKLRQSSFTATAASLVRCWEPFQVLVLQPMPRTQLHSTVRKCALAFA